MTSNCWLCPANSDRVRMDAGVGREAGAFVGSPFSFAMLSEVTAFSHPEMG